MHTIEPILDVVFGQADRPKFRVRVAREAKDALEHASELHGFRWRMQGHGGIYGFEATICVGVVTQDTGATIAFLLDSGRAELEGWEVLDQEAVG